MQTIKLRLSDKLDLNVAFDGGPADTSVNYVVPANSESKIQVNASGVITPINLGVAVIQVFDADTGNLIRNLLVQIQTDAQYAFDLANAAALAGVFPPARTVLDSANAGNAVAIDDVVQSSTNVTVNFVSEKVYSQAYRLTLLDPTGNPVVLSSGLTYLDVTQDGSLHTAVLIPQNPYILETGAYTATVSDLDDLGDFADQPVAYVQVPAMQSASGVNALVGAVTDQVTGDVTLTFAEMSDPLVATPTHIRVTLNITGESRLVPLAAFPFTYVWENLGQGNYMFTAALYDAGSTTTGSALDNVTVGLPSSPYLPNRIKDIAGANVGVNTVEISWTSSQSTGSYKVSLIKQGTGTEYVLDAGTVRAGTSHSVQYTFTEQGTYDVKIVDISGSADTASFNQTAGGLFDNDDADPTPPTISAPDISWSADQLTITFDPPVENETTLVEDKISVLVGGNEVAMWDSNLVSPIVFSLPSVYSGSQEVEVVRYVENSLGLNDTKSSELTVSMKVDGSAPSVSATSLTWVDSGNGIDGDLSLVFSASDTESEIASLSASIVVDGGAPTVVDLTSEASPYVWSFNKTYLDQSVAITLTATNGQGGQATSMVSSTVVARPDLTAPSVGTPLTSWDANTLTVTFTKASDAESGVTAESLEVYIGGSLSTSRNILALSSPQTFTVNQTGSAQTVMVRHKATNGASLQTSVDSANLNVPANVDTSPPTVSAPSLSQVGIVNGSGGVLRVTYTAASDPQSGINYGGNPDKLALGLYKDGSFYTGYSLVNNVNGTYDFSNYGAGTYFVRLIATNGDGYSTTVDSNSTAIAAPDTTPPQMAGGASSMVISQNGSNELRGLTGAISDNQTSLWWSGASPYVGVTLYRNGVAVHGPDQQYFGNLSTGSGLNWGSGRPSGTYTFKVEAYDGAGNYNSWTSPEFVKSNSL